MLTDDENIIDIQFAVQYKLKMPNGCSTTATGRHRAPGGRDRDPRNRRPQQDGLRAVRRPRKVAST
jgi:hypothetical protein